MNLDFMPSPIEDRPGLLIRDPFRYSDATLVVPPALVGCLECFDGERTDLDLRAALVRITGDFQVGELEQHLIDSLSQAGFLEDDRFQQLRQACHEEFARQERRQPSHSGSAYPAAPDELRTTLDEYLKEGAAAQAGDLIGIAAPHISPDGGRECYRAAYRALDERYRDRVFVILGTSHYGEPDRFGLTRKPFAPPLGEARTQADLVDRLAAAAPDAIQMEDYCHAVEHSIEFQVVFLQYVLGPDVKILPILCGAFLRGLANGGPPEEHEPVRRFLEALGELGAAEAQRLFWVLGIDMAHMGRRYGDPFPAAADRGKMAEVAVRDAARIDRVEAGDAEGFWNLIGGANDDLKWCGASPLYTFLRAVPGARGSLLRYQQWNIDEQSVVSFGSMAFRDATRSAAG
jgi:AmmeMemoRadiSam system protein B